MSIQNCGKQHVLIASVFLVLTHWHPHAVQVPSTPGWLQIAWGRPQYASCQMPWTWLQLAQGFQVNVACLRTSILADIKASAWRFHRIE